MVLAGSGADAAVQAGPAAAEASATARWVSSIWRSPICSRPSGSHRSSPGSPPSWWTCSRKSVRTRPTRCSSPGDPVHRAGAARCGCRPAVGRPGRPGRTGSVGSPTPSACTDGPAARWVTIWRSCRPRSRRCRCCSGTRTASRRSTDSRPPWVRSSPLQSRVDLLWAAGRLAEARVGAGADEHRGSGRPVPRARDAGRGVPRGRAPRGGPRRCLDPGGGVPRTTIPGRSPPSGPWRPPAATSRPPGGCYAGRSS